MPSRQASLLQLREAFQAFGSELKESGRATGRAIIKPAKLQPAADGATRAGQAIALLVLGPIIMVSLTLIQVLNQLMADVLGTGLIEGDQLTITGFIITALTLTVLIIVAWGWFQFVRTAGFGAFNHD